MATSSWPRPIVPALLALAALALVGPWYDGGTASRIALGIASASVLAAFGLTCWEFGTAAGAKRPQPVPDPSMPPVSPIREGEAHAETGGTPRVSSGSAGASPSRGVDGSGGRAEDFVRLLDRLDRIAAALEARPIREANAPDVLATIADAIAGGRWIEADSLLAEHSDHPDAARYAQQVASAKEAAASSLRDELEAARAVNDPDRVFEIHERLAAVVTAEALAEVEGQVVKWLLALVMRRLRGGTVRPDVAEMAAKVADRFPRSVEGASLRVSLGTLRRSAGLCPRCARPYRGIADACPLCLAGPPIPSTVVEPIPKGSTWDDPPVGGRRGDGRSSSRGAGLPRVPQRPNLTRLRMSVRMNRPQLNRSAPAPAPERIAP